MGKALHTFMQSSQMQPLPHNRILQLAVGLGVIWYECLHLSCYYIITQGF